MRLNSLAFRLIATAAAWTLLALPVAGYIILSLYRHDIETDFNQRISRLLTVIQSDSLDGAGQEPVAPKDVGEPLFEITHSGWYWQIRPVGDAPGRRLISPSLATSTLASPIDQQRPIGAFGHYWIDASGPDNQRVRIAEVTFPFGEEPTAPLYAYSVAGDLDWLDVKIVAFRDRLFQALAVVGVGLLALTLMQVRFGLAPLRRVERELAAIRSGEAESLAGDVPTEIEPLQRELNALIKSNQDIIERARTQVGNLAHGLKTPLAVITNEARDDKSGFGRKVAAQAELMRGQINHYLERARIAARVETIGRVTEVRPVADGLKRALERIYGDKGVTIEVVCADAVRFQGEKQDLEEMLGNLLDNACKWSGGRVTMEARLASPAGRTGSRRLLIAIDDDGPGLSEQERARLGKRGLRLDESKPGTGLGLSIVADLAQTYRGEMRLEASPLGGLGARLDLPAA